MLFNGCALSLRGWRSREVPTLEPPLVRIQLVLHAVGRLLALIVATALSIYKTWGKGQSSNDS